MYSICVQMQFPISSLMISIYNPISVHLYPPAGFGLPGCRINSTDVNIAIVIWLTNINCAHYRLLKLPSLVSISSSVFSADILGFLASSTMSSDQLRESVGRNSIA